MPLQGDNLAALGLGVIADEPAGANTVVGGIHLRYGFARERGFPLHGYYLFRRPHRESKPICIRPPPRKIEIALPTFVWSVPQGEFRSSAPIRYDESFAPSDQSEIDLRECNSFQFTTAPGQSAREFRLTLGFYATAKPAGDGDTRPAGGTPTEPTRGQGAVDAAAPPESANCLARLIAIILRIIQAITAALAPPAPAPVPVIGPARIRAYRGTALVAETQISAAAGQTATAVLSGDAMDRLEIVPGQWAMIELCLVPALQDAAAGWQRLSDFPYPLCLPSAHPDYPCAGKPADISLAQAAAKSRVRYGDPNIWDDGRFTEMTALLDEILVGGAAAGRMCDRVSPDYVVGGATGDPVIPDLYPLDILLFAALNPSVAQALGLYWIDRTAADNVAYDYLVLADHDDSFHGDPASAVAAVASGNLSPNVDGWIAFNLRKATPAPLAPPDRPLCYALPGGVVASSDPGASAPAGTNTAGLRWSLPLASSGDLLPGGAIFYHLWRSDLNAAAPALAPPVSSYTLKTADAPIIVAGADVPAGTVLQSASDWPPLRMFAYDRGLADGWYSYRLSGVDIFGRFSALSDTAHWCQWAPVPDPRPWYYSGAASDAELNLYAVHLRDTTPPPAPPGAVASALDPLDPMLVQDGPFANWLAQDWWNNLPAAQKDGHIGVRVSWRWTRSQMLQAPDTQEFRIYFNPGSTAPGPDSRAPGNWSARIFVVAYGQHVTVDLTTGERRYDVLLPIPNDAGFAGVPLAPDNAHPVAYGQIGVSAADDKQATSDDPKWQGTPYGNRPGNEGRLSVPAQIYRVLRAPPPPPGIADASDKVWATPADYHSLSYYTFRWPKPSADAALIDAHVFRAMDEALFEFDFRQRPRAALDVANDALFPVPAWNPTTRGLIAAELDQLNTLTPIAPGDGEAAVATRIRDALPAYRGLSDNALRTLASLPGDSLKPGNDGAFAQVTILPLKHADPANGDRVGPDGSAGYVPDPALCAYRAELDGLARNRYFFRVAFVNAAHDMGAPGPSSPPVYLPKVAAARTPAITKVLGGDRQITLSFASNREDDLAEYRIYRAGDERSARDIRLMTLVGTVPETQPDPALRPRERNWTDVGLPAGQVFHYRLTARDAARNETPPTAAAIGRAIDLAPVVAPQWVSAQWVLYDPGTETMLSWAAVPPAPYVPAVRLELASTAALCSVYRRKDGEKPWQGVVQSVAPVAGEIVLFDLGATATEKTSYRAAGVNQLGASSPYSAVLTVDPQ
jgi:hypothetical protein